MPSSSTDSSSRTSKARFEFRDIDYDHNLFGVWARAGDRAVEVIQAYNNEWFCYATIGDRVCRIIGVNVSKTDALAWARKFLCAEITPWTRPDCVCLIPGAA